jgi:hypothetical protein
MITCFRTLKSFSLGMEDVIDDRWAYIKGVWRKLRPNYKDSEWYDDYPYGIANTSDMLECWLTYLPGVECWDNYGDFCVTFDMNEVKEAGWNHWQLFDILGDMARHVKMRLMIHAETPWLHTGTDAYGSEFTRYMHPTIEPLEGMLDKDFPANLEPTG